MVVVKKVADLATLVDDAATRFIEVVAQAQSSSSSGVHGDGRARVVLTGGTAGIKVLERVAQLSGIDWTKVHVYFGDERNVPVTHADSNEGQARAALLDKVAIPQEHVHGYGLGKVDLDDAAADYESVLAKTAPQGFDLHLLGMGHEGHINSLFPHTAHVAETERLVLPVKDSPKPPAERVTLTLPAVRRANRVWLLVDGAEKAEATGHVVRRSQAIDWPAAGAEGRVETVLFVSETAATEI
ncbi:6-phosphogluconolactonase [Corynebacterium breve]|uniref:6-phosphogluconolactonase n=1 Tax=Corynebacterium breve TaxID=3049799 RepID=A0ABY8VHT2_9CORY|nr:6-phosphogluconolactonase [Corynebacterium breve]WIM68892.1 6-phosphogluconolactonase [Corynebacterium breve]